MVSIFTINSGTSIFCGSGGQCDITNSNSSFGEFGLIAEDVSPVQYLGLTTTASGIGSDRIQIKLGGVKGLEITDFVYDQDYWIFNCNNWLRGPRTFRWLWCFVTGYRNDLSYRIWSDCRYQ